MSKIDAAKFVFHCRNWPELVVPIAVHHNPGRVTLKNGICLESPDIHWPDIYGIFFQQMYTPPFLPLEPDDSVVDIGANIGVFSLYAALYTQNVIHAFEPFPSNFAALCHNIEQNGLSSRILPHQEAISDTNGIERFSATSDAWYLLKVGRQDEYLEVKSLTLAEMMERYGLPQIDFLKMDCEGSEGLILRSTSPAVLSCIRKLALEFHDRLSPLKHAQLQALLQDAGFRTMLVWDSKSPRGFLYARRR